MSDKTVIGLKPQQKKALDASNNPSDINAVATMADVLAGSGGNRIITGSASYSGSGLTYDVTALTYIIQGTLYASLATQVTLATADPTDPRIDVILVDTLGTVSVLTGTPAPVPSKPTVDNLTEVEITFVSVPAGATSPPIVIETIYDEDAGSGGGEWDATTDGTVLLASVADPHQGTVSIETNPTLGPNKKISLMPGAPYTINGGQLSFWLQAKSDMTSASDAFYIGFFNSGVLEGNTVTIAGSPAISFGFDPSIVGAYQLVTVPIAAFGGLSATVDELRFFKLGGASTSEFFLDDIQIEEGVPTPPSPIEGHEVYDETIALTQRPKIRFLGAGVTATDNPSEDATDVTIPGGGGGGTLDSLTDTNITAPALDDVLIYDGVSDWINSPSKNSVAATLLIAGWVADAGFYYQDIVHGLGTEDVDVTLFDLSTKGDILPDRIIRTDANTVRVYISVNTIDVRALVSPQQLVVQGNSGRNVVLNPVSPYTVQNNDIVIWDCTGGNKIANLPVAATANNFRFDIKKIDGSVNTITVDPDGAELIEDGSTAVITTQYEAISGTCDGGAWWILASI